MVTFRHVVLTQSLQHCGTTNRETLVTQLQLVQDTNTILEQWRSHYEREIVNLQLAKVEAEGVHRQDTSEKEEQIASVSFVTVLVCASLTTCEITVN